MLSDKVLNSLELNKVFISIKHYLCLEKSNDVLMSEKPVETFLDMKKRLSLTKEADITISQHNIDPVNSYDDVDKILIKAEKLVTLTIVEILRAARLYRSSRLFKTKIAQINDDRLNILTDFASKIYIDKGFEEEADRCFISEEQISDNASDTLMTIRKNIRKNNEDIKEILSTILRSDAYSKYIQDSYVTIRNGRYVIPVKTEFKNTVKGMLHDQSSTGSTVYIEPEAVVQLNNELKILQIKENEEIEKILKRFTAMVSAVVDNLRINDEILIKADIAFAKAKYAHSTKAVYPLLNSEGYINIVNGKHPLIDKHVIVPVSLKLGRDYNFLIITGPNTGGKTVTLKLCGLFTAMAMCGIFIPASDGTEISFFENIFTDIGDEQSIENSLSTFSSHMKNIVDICNNVNNSSLVLIDEIGAGTDPVEGAALALSVIEHILKFNCRGIITTHYNEIKEFALLKEGAINASMEFDPVKLRPTYKLKIGMPGSSNALEISKKLGLKEEIISLAYKRLSNEKIIFDKVLKSAEEARTKAENNLLETEIAKKEYLTKLEEIKKEEKKLKDLKENIMQNAKADAKRIYATAVIDSEELISELKEIIKKEEINEYDLNRSRQIKKQLENKKYNYESLETDTQNMIKVQKNDLEIGQQVFIKSLSSYCFIADILKNKEDVTVKIGDLLINTKISDIYYSHNSPANNMFEDKKQTISVIKKFNTVSTVSEIKLLGQTVLEALPNVDVFLDNCSINGIKECKIIHGIGTGKLRKAVWEHLKTQPLVEEYRFGKYGEGEKGVTIVILK